MSTLAWIINNKLLTLAGTALVGLGIAAVKQMKEAEKMAAFGPDYDDRFFQAYARGFEETKDLDW